MIFNTDKRLTIYLVRHGESYMNLNHKDLIGGRSGETPLSKLGHEQAIKLGEYFNRNKFHIDKLHTSSLIRAADTAKLLNAELNTSHDILYWDELVEFTQGDWEKQLRKDIYSLENMNYINQQGAFFTPPHGESKAMVVQRVSTWFQKEILSTCNESSSHMIVCHGLVIKCFLYHIMGFSDSLIHKIAIDNTSVTKLTFKHTGWHVDYINRISHL